MMKTLVSAASLVAAVLLAPTGANAVEFNQLVADKSAVSFVFRQMNVPIDGRFRRFKGQVSFDPARPAAARADVEIDLASIDAGSADANDEVANKLWFDTKTTPTARFVSSSVKVLGGNRFEVAGRMTIKGRTRDAVMPATFRQEGSSGVFEGSFALKRADYAIGEGMWADFGTVANEITVKFRLVTTAAAKN